MVIDFDSEPVYGVNDKCIKTRIKPYGDKLNTNGNRISNKVFKVIKYQKKMHRVSVCHS